MPTIVLLIGILITLLGLLGVVVPERLVALVTSWQGPSRLWGAVIFRLIFGVVFILAAPDCRWPIFIQVIGIFGIAAALGMAVMGTKRLDTFIAWWTARVPSFIRAWTLLALVFGLLIVYGAG